jgi:L-threonylcarbamoyladenylate synthase
LGLADNLVGNDGSIAIRICRDIFCRHLLKRFRKPIVSTSANLSGEKTPLIFHEIDGQIKNGIDYIVHYRQEDMVISAPSSLIMWNKDGTVTILRS